jgi:asparagine synthase (glutamine-hydrolysing)
MSGICGIIRFDEEMVKKDEIQNMLQAMQNCGNDAEGIWIDGNVGFGHKALWTTPESLHENQPQISKDETLIITADARIDNRDELFEKLKINESSFKVITDVELILLAYQKWGKDCTKYFVGDYAFSLWDVRNKKLFCSRSPIGVKPFYYYTNKNYFIFASEIFIIQEIVAKDVRELDIESIKTFIDTWVIPCEKTCFNKINRLVPAHNLIVYNKEIKNERFWFPERIQIDQNLSFEDSKLMFVEVMKSAISSMLRSAYPIGCELSGGLDSTTVLTIAEDIENSQVMFPISSYYGDLSCDESHYIKSVAKKLNVKPLINNALSLNYQDEFSLKKYYQISSDWPASGSCLDNLNVFTLAQKNNIRVILTGQGGDHVATGNYFMLADYLKSFRFIELYKEMHPLNFSWKMFKRYAISPLLPSSLKNIFRYINGKQINKKITQVDRCYNKENEKVASYAQSFDLGVATGVTSSIWADISPHRKAGHFNIEYRHPFFDKRVIEFMLSLPASYKMQRGITKFVLREAMKGKIPDIVYQRTDKAEFSPIIMFQMKSLDINKLLNFSNLLKYGIIKNSDLSLSQKMKDEKCNGIVSNIKLKVWRLIYMEVWLSLIKKGKK